MQLALCALSKNLLAACFVHLRAASLATLFGCCRHLGVSVFGTIQALAPQYGQAMPPFKLFHESWATRYRLWESFLGPRPSNRLSVCETHALLVDENACLFGVGEGNYNGELGMTSPGDWPVDGLPLPLSVDEAIRSVAAGYHYSVVSTATGALWVLPKEWFSGMLCEDSASDDLSEHTDPPVPQLCTKLEQSFIVEVSAGRSFWIALSAEGQAYTCGDNGYGQLGHGLGFPDHGPEPLQFQALQYVATRSHSRRQGVQLGGELRIPTGPGT